jgi:large subunit ribosomal protein L40e
MIPKKNKWYSKLIFGEKLIGKEKNTNNIIILFELMPITDATKKQIAQQRRLFYKICFKCGGRNPISSDRCRKCHSQKMRLKNRNIGAKK